MGPWGQRDGVAHHLSNHEWPMALEGKGSSGDPRSLASQAEHGRRVNDRDVQGPAGGLLRCSADVHGEAVGIGRVV